MKQFYLTLFLLATLALKAQTYCAAASNTVNYEYIQNVQLKETASTTVVLNNSSGSGMYQDFTSATASVNKGSMYSLV